MFPSPWLRRTAKRQRERGAGVAAAMGRATHTSPSESIEGSPRSCDRISITRLAPQGARSEVKRPQRRPWPRCHPRSGTVRAAPWQRPRPRRCRAGFCMAGEVDLVAEPPSIVSISAGLIEQATTSTSSSPARGAPGSGVSMQRTTGSAGPMAVSAAVFMRVFRWRNRKSQRVGGRPTQAEPSPWRRIATPAGCCSDRRGKRARS